MNDDLRDRWHEATERAHELLERAALADAEREADDAERRRRNLVDDAPPPPPDWARFRTVADMSQREFSLWVDVGKPALGRPKPALVVDATGQAFPEERQKMRAHVAKRLEGFAAMLGEEIAKMRKQDRDRFTNEITALRSEIGLLRAQVQAQAAEARRELKRAVPRRPTMTSGARRAAQH